MMVRRLILPLSVAAGLALPVVLLLRDFEASGGSPGFPLDDPYIHLTFARNLAQHHTWAYFPGDPPVAGSTSPLYTLLAAAGLALGLGERTVSFALGLAAHLGFLSVLALWARRRLQSPAWAGAAVLLVALDGRLGLLAVSGMETSLFLLCVALAFHFLAAGRARACGLALGAGLWVRPDGLILALAVYLSLLDRGARADPAPVPGDERRRRLHIAWQLGLPLLALAGLYVALNLYVGGTALPNTFAAKTTYYDVNPRWLFVQTDLWRLAVAGGGWVLLPFALVAMIRAGLGLLHRQQGTGLVAEAAWALGLPLAYLVMLPYAHWFQRYLIPAVPALTILGLEGLRRSVPWAVRIHPLLGHRAAATAITAAVLLSAGAMRLGFAVEADQEYLAKCQFIRQRHERTGRWLASHTPTSAVVATHDIGAIAFYSGRRVIDVVGLVLPEAIDYLHRTGYPAYLQRLFAREGVTHVAVLRSWLELDNMNPVFFTGQPFEVMEVFNWDPARGHIVPADVTNNRKVVFAALRNGDLQRAGAAAWQLVQMDPLSSRSWTVLGMVTQAQREPLWARLAFATALALHPENPVASKALSRPLP